jgi:hypothetical protein
MYFFYLLKSRALGQTNITGKSADFTSDFLHALFALHNCGVDFVNTFNNIGLVVCFCNFCKKKRMKKVLCWNPVNSEKELRYTIRRKDLAQT